MKKSRSLFAALGGASLLLLLVVPTTLAASSTPPVVSLGPLQNLYDQLTPWVALAFVAMGLVAAVSRLWQVLGNVGGTNMFGSSGPGSNNSIGSILTTLIMIVGVVAAAEVLLFYWIPLINGAISILWSIMDGSVAPPSLPGSGVAASALP